MDIMPFIIGIIALIIGIIGAVFSMCGAVFMIWIPLEHQPGRRLGAPLTGLI